MAPKDRCPCGSGRTYEACCAPFHRGEREAPDAETLMRSRFSAFAKREVDYLYRTLHAENEDRLRPREKVIAELRESVQNYRYLGLTVLDTAPPDADGIARVLFVARIFHRGSDRSFAEASSFARENGAWKYVHGVGLPLSRIPFDPATKRVGDFVAAVEALGG